MPIDLRPMTAESFQRFMDRAIPDYAAEKVRSGEWSEAEAVERSTADFRDLLPDGLDSAGNFLFDLHDPELGQDVGVLWYALRTNGGEPSAFVYEVAVFPQFQRRGYASEAFRLLDRHAAAQGASRVRLHVFGHNHPARALYERLGFEPTNLILSRPIR
ncbi:GNAT family N-acetyltransferase [Deinococcus sonorensis]|uniref:GNAT family N-acetyltransferase n=2 Tax=Deinococcus sonorensis TaxID=309891 RepID=A0AAU7U9K5_9DEIO